MFNNYQKASDQLFRYVETHTPIIFFRTKDERVSDSIIMDACKNREIYEWNYCDGFIDAKTKSPVLELDNCSIQTLLSMITERDLITNSVVILKDFVDYLSDSTIRFTLKKAIYNIVSGADFSIIVEASDFVIPTDINPYVAFFEIDSLTYEDTRQLITDFCDQFGIRNDLGLLDKLSTALSGLSEYDITHLLSLSYAYEHGILTDKCIPFIYEEKKQIIKKTGLLDLVNQKEEYDEIGGLEIFKNYITNKALVFKNISKAKRFGVDVPKGILLAGVPGCGKSLASKTVARVFQVPLLRLDMGKILAKYLGESEKNLRNSLSQAEEMAPCVLWIDEMEKGISVSRTSGESNDAITRILGTLLTWMQEKDSPVFIVATVNSIDNLPKELLRKGRFDEMFFVDLPDLKERKEIAKIHLTKRRSGESCEEILDEIANRTAGFSGAEIENCISTAIENAYIDGLVNVSNEYYINAITNAHSFSRTTAEDYKKSRESFLSLGFRPASRGTDNG